MVSISALLAPAWSFVGPVFSLFEGIVSARGYGMVEGFAKSGGRVEGGTQGCPLTDGLRRRVRIAPGRDGLDPGQERAYPGGDAWELSSIRSSQTGCARRYWG